MPGFICIAALATMLSAYSGASSSEGNSPVQPVAFRHTIHADTLKMNCLYCHFSANKSFDPGLPAVGTCMGCHTVVSGSSPGNKAEIQKLAGYWNKKEPVPWIRIHKLPGVRALPAHEARERGRDVSDVPRPDPEHEAGIPGVVAQHGLVRQLSHRTVESALPREIRLQLVPLLVE